MEGMCADVAEKRISGGSDKRSKGDVFGSPDMSLRISRAQLQTLRSAESSAELKEVIQQLVNDVRAERRQRRATRSDRFEAPPGPDAAPPQRTRPASPVAAPQGELAVGMQGPEVEALQRALVSLGYMTQEQMDSGPGVFGPRTTGSLQQFQSDWGVPATGNYGPLTKDALGRALAGEERPPPPPPETWDGTRPAPGTTETRAWLSVNAPEKGSPNARSRATYDNVINQFAVGTNPRYTPRNGDTFCNIFASDVTKAMGAPIPHWVNGAGDPVPDFQGHELDANNTNAWLHQHGGRHGWRQVSAAEAQRLANEGHPAVATWRNPGGIGHIGVIRPGEQNGNGPALAQAGAENFNHGHVFDVFPRNGTEFWVNDRGTSADAPTPSPTPDPATGPSANVPQIDLQRGMGGDEVEALQSSLVKLGFMAQADMDSGPGIFGPRTEGAVKAFQSAWSVPSTGYYGPLTREALTKALSGAQAPTAPSRSIPGAQQAISYAQNPPSNPMNPSGSWHYWCLGLVNQAYQSSGRVIPELQKPKAYDSYLAYANQGKVQTEGTPPRGALVFFDSFMPYGHIGISLGDGSYIGTLESGPQTGVRTLNTPTYLGWAYP